MSRLDAMTPRKRGDKTYWIRVGSAWPNKKGPGYQIVLDALPLPDAEGRCVINLFEPRQRDERPSQEAPVRDDRDQEIPFG